MKYDKVYLRKRPQYDEMIDEIELKQPKIKYPDRVAQFMRNSPYLSQFDGDQSFINMEEQESNIAKEQMLQQAMKLLASRNGLTHSLLQARSSISNSSVRSVSSPREATRFYDIYTGNSTPEIDHNDAQQALDEELEKRDMMLEDKRSRFMLDQGKLETEHERVYEDFLSPSYYPSAPPLTPLTPPQSPIVPRRLEDELQSPGDSVKKKINERFKKALEAKEKAKADKAASQQRFNEEQFVFQPSSSSSSPNVAESKASSSNAKLNYYKNKTEMLKLSKAELFTQIDLRKQDLKKRGVAFDNTSTVTVLRRIVDEHKDLFLTSSPIKK